MTATNKAKKKRRESGWPSSDSLDDLKVSGPAKKLIERVYRAHLKNGLIVQGEAIPISDENRTITFTFDEKGRKTSQEMYFRENDSHTNFYNSEGYEIRYENHKNGKLTSYGENEYDEKGNRTKSMHYHLEEGTSSYYLWEDYDENGNYRSYKSFDKDGNLSETAWLTYDEDGNKIEDIRKKPDGTISYWGKSTYDKFGYATEQLTLKPDGTVEHRRNTTYSYDADGNLIGMDGRPLNRRKLEYKEMEPDGYGNWTIKVGFHKNAPVEIVRRNFEYYGETGKDTPIRPLDEASVAIPYKPAEKVKDIYERHSKIHYEIPVMKKEKTLHDASLSAEDARWIAEGSTAENFSAVRYYVARNNDVPSVTHYSAMDIEALALLHELQESLDATIIHAYDQDSTYADILPNRFTVGFPNPNYILQATYVSVKKGDYFYYAAKSDHWDDGYTRISQFSLFRPSDASGRRDLEFEESIQNCIDICTIERDEDKPEISMVEVQPDGKFKLSTYPVNDSFVIRDLDMHYGYGFEKFHNELIERFRKETQGLVLFHGAPGTGKTYYIRHLLKKMTSYNKVVIYMPPNMVEWLVDPKFLNFLSKEISGYSRQGLFCVLLIEDAEPLLAVRHENGRVQGISNLLNMTDGLLNDMLKMQIICTFNVKVKELDKALLRPGRLIARKEFRPMSVLDANRLAQQLGLKHQFTKPATLAEVYSFDKNKSTLIHDEGDKYLDD